MSSTPEEQAEALHKCYQLILREMADIVMGRVPEVDLDAQEPEVEEPEPLNPEPATTS